MFSTSSLKRVIVVMGCLVVLAVFLVGWCLMGNDAIPGLIVAVLPTALGVVCAIQAIKSEPTPYRRRWSTIYAVSGVIISSAFIWQQYSAEQRASVERKQLQDQIELMGNRALLKIEDVSVSFLIKVPVDHPELLGFRERVERCAEEMRKVSALRCGAAPHTINSVPSAIKDFFIKPGTELYPNQQSESTAYTLLNSPHVVVGLFKDAPPSSQQLFSFSTRPDLRFSITAELDGPENRNPIGRAYVGLIYDIDTKGFSVEGNMVPVNNATWRSNGKIASLPDLQNAFTTLNPSTYRPTVSLANGPTQEWITAMEISRTISLQTLTLHISRGHEYEFSKARLDTATRSRDENGSPVYLLKVIE